jgi:hypothetical protein
MRDNADRVKESSECLDKIKWQQSETGSICWCSKATTVLLELTVLSTEDVGLLCFYCIRNK